MYLKRIVSVCLILAGSSLLAQPADVKLRGPRQAKAGISTGFTLEVRNSKLSGPVRFVQVLPAGWSARVHPGYENNLSQVGDTLRYSWFSFPASDSLKLYFEVDVPENAKGSHFLKSRLEYFEGNQLRKIPLPPHEIKLVPFYKRGQ